MLCIGDVFSVVKAFSFLGKIDGNTISPLENFALARYTYPTQTNDHALIVTSYKYNG